MTSDKQFRNNAGEKQALGNEFQIIRSNQRVLNIEFKTI